jgi:hypothetical protein
MPAAVGKPATVRRDPTTTGTSKLVVTLGANNIRDPSNIRDPTAETLLIARKPAPAWRDPTTTGTAVLAVHMRQ